MALQNIYSKLNKTLFDIQYDNTDHIQQLLKIITKQPDIENQGESLVVPTILIHSTKLKEFLQPLTIETVDFYVCRSASS